MKKLALILFIVFGILLCYGDITGNYLLRRIGIYSIIPCITTYYLFTTKKKNTLFLVALVASYIGDITFNKEGLTIDLISLGGFIIFNLLMLIIVFERMRYVKFRNVLVYTAIIGTILTYLSYSIIDIIDKTFIIIGIYCLSISLLSAFCVVYYLKGKSKEAMYFLIGVVSYIIASITKEFEYIESTSTALIILNVSSYLSTLYFYCKALLEDDNIEPKKKLITIP